MLRAVFYMRHGFRPGFGQVYKAALQALILIVTVTCCRQGMAASVHDVEHLKVKDAHFGEALLYAYQGNYPLSMAHLAAFGKLRQLPSQKEDGDLLWAILQFSYGMANEAKGSFSNILSNKKYSQTTHDIAALYLAKIHYGQGTPLEAERMAFFAGDTLPARLKKEKYLLMADLLRGKNQHKEAEKILSSLDEDGEIATLKRYAQYNLGIALLRDGLKNSQSFQGIDILKKISAEYFDGSESRTLQDKVNLALGYIHLHFGEMEPAIEYFEKIRIAGLFSSRALLGLGLAEAALGRHKRALIPWLELDEGDIIEMEVGEAALLVPEALFKLESYKKSENAYQHAISRYSSEIEAVSAAITAVRASETIPAGLAARGKEGGWPDNFSGMGPIGLDARYFSWLIRRDADFRQAIALYQEADELRGALVSQKEKLGDYGLDAAVTVRYAATISGKIANVENATRKLESYLQDLAIERLEKRKISLTSYLSQANLGLAKVYHHATERGGAIR
jgi:tetratricopeptide (TPR) repeat protein